MLRRIFLLGTLGLAAACTRVPPSPEVISSEITLEQAFAGQARGKGLFRIGITGSERRFDALLNGTLEGDRLTVVEDFVYDDGEENRLTWVFDRTGPGTWKGRREDTVGFAEVIENGTEIRLRYTADFVSGDDVTRLGFEDVIYYAEDGTLVNDAIVTRFGIPVATVKFEMTKL